jgi:hypothetical protein
MNEFDKAVEIYLAVNADYNEADYNAYLSFISNAGISNSEVYDHCELNGLFG